MEFIQLFVQHRKTFLQEIRHPATCDHILFKQAREIVTESIQNFYDAADLKLSGKPLSDEQKDFFI
jgi:hypothetical protein